MVNSKNFDLIRIVALISVLLLHTRSLNCYATGVYRSINANFVYDIVYSNLFKSGTIIFFIISGFLFQMQIKRNISFPDYIRNKANSLLKPYVLLFFLPTILILSLVKPYIGVVKFDLSWSEFFDKCLESIFNGAYWFVPALFITLIINYFISTAALMKWTLISLLLWVISYANIYLQITTSAHSVWIIGFFIIFNIGRYIFIYNDRLSDYSFLKSYSFLISMMVLCFAISCMESMLIFYNFKNNDFVNTFRIGNILYSIVVFFLANMVFSNKQIVVSKSYNFYFMYLVHPFVLDGIGYIVRFIGVPVYAYPIQLYFNLFFFFLLAILLLIIQGIFNRIKYRDIFISRLIFKHK